MHSVPTSFCRWYALGIMSKPPIGSSATRSFPRGHFLRQLVAKILPVPVLNTLRDLRDRKRLGVVRPLQFDATHLRRTGDCESLLASFTDASIEPSWHDAQAEIAAVMSDA